MERHSVVASLVGAQAPLGYQGIDPARLQTETTRNGGAPEMQHQMINNVRSEHVHGGDGNEDLST